MDKVKRCGRDLSLRKSLVIYVISFTVLALVLLSITSFLCDRAIDEIRSWYPLAGEKYYLTNEQGEQLGDGVFVGDTTIPMSKRDERFIELLGILPAISAPVYSALCIMAAALLFYRNKLKEPLEELRIASRKITENDLDFSIKYNSKDELGQLCISFETMRTVLAGNFSMMWRQVEERRQLNAAFAHDLRTPLTVLKGYSEILQADEHARTKEIAGTMGKHILRMEAYVSSMSNLCRIEDAKPEWKPVFMQPFLESLYESANIVCAQNEKKLLLHNEVSVSQLTLDGAFVLQVCNNLISNAVRYAETTVILSFALWDNCFLLSVSDDGKGFDKSSLNQVTAPYFTEETNNPEHFGIGLYICRLLCEHHGGHLEITNIENGSKVSAFFLCQPDR